MQESKNTTKGKPFADPVTEEDVKVVVKRALGCNAKIVNFQLRSYSEEKLGFLGSHRHLVVTIRRDDTEEKEIHTFFVKSVPYDIEIQASVIEDCRAFFKETHFYKHMVAELLGSVKDKSWIAQCYLVKDDVLIFEDLKSKNFALKDHFLDLQGFKSGLTALANLHASSVLAEKRLGKTFNELYPELVKESLFDKKVKFFAWYQSGVDLACNLVTHFGFDATKIPQICDKAFEKFKASEKWRNVVCHGDLKSFNLMFDNSCAVPKCVIVDFQLLRYCPAMVDVSQMLYLATRREFRERYETELLKHYHEVFCTNLRENDAEIALPTFQEILQEFTDMRVVGVVTANLYFPTQHLDGKRCAELTSTSDGFNQLLFGNRVKLVLDTMKEDQYFNEIITEITMELIRRSQEFLQL
ncbi:uncharacterized protein LOC106644109 [Copidosoma floridanum]|uniref:uncharacterized protein LOC106644109 n=1 Tax=Copidosoma floridanum TaxID=29053 RepID=UPI0006C9E27E|nr:uncharacterized protein LOC106644109 [Copidosoma floridanum]